MPGAETEIMRRRDTDADWRELGRSNPYWAVLSSPDFLSENLTPEKVEFFYSSGPFHIDPIVRDLEAFTGERPSGRALDFGCGVGRLSEAMTRYAAEVTGVDVSPGMLEIARGRGSKVTYSETLPDGPFDWINSFIVFQHIPPHRGLAIIADLMDRLADGGMVSLQVTTWSDAGKAWPEPAPKRGLFGALRARREHRSWMESLPVGHIHMYEYDLSKVLRLMNLAGIETFKLVATNHDGHHGVIILGRKTAPATTDS